MSASKIVLGSALALLVLSGCPGEQNPDGNDGGAPPPDACNTLEEASSADCELALGASREAYLSFAGDEDWYSFRVPANANARTLVHVSGGYAVPNTAVNLALNLLREDGQQSLVRKSDRHGQAAPKPVDIVLPFSEANARLLVLVTDDPLNPSKPNFDVRAPYRLQVEVVEDPDANEPNDTTPTPIALSGGAGTSTGYLSTNGDVDAFSFDVAAGKVLYLSVTAPALTPPPPFRLSYELYDPSGTRISEGISQNEFLAANLATARRTRAGGTYRVVVKGYAGQTTDIVPGDLRLQYTVGVRTFDEGDLQDSGGGNDTFETASSSTLSATGQSRTFTGRIGSVADPDWFRVELAANSAPTVLHYRLRPGSGAGRFPALPGEADRELRVLTPVVTGNGANADATACLQDPAVCPKSFGNDAFLAGLVGEQCSQFTPARCLWSYRVEHPEFASLRNFEGALPVPPHNGAVSFFFLVQDAQNNWADDADYTLELTWRGDPDDAARYSGTTEQPTQRVLAEDTTSSTFPVPPTGAAYEFSGRLSHGYGYFRQNDPNVGQGVRGPRDYDAVSSDRDRYELSLPMLDPDAGFLDRTWEIEWEVAHLPDGGMPYDVAIDLEFCDGSLSTAQCVPVKTTSRGAPLTLAYQSGPRNSWHNPNATTTERQPLYDRDVTSVSTTTTARAYGCFCFEKRFMQGGKFFMNVVGVDRQSYGDSQYTVRTAYTSYPKGYATNDGGTASCPPPSADGGCYFTYQP